MKPNYTKQGENIHNILDKADKRNKPASVPNTNIHVVVSKNGFTWKGTLKSFRTLGLGKENFNEISNSKFLWN